MEWLHASELRLMAGGRANYFKGARDAWRWLQATSGGRGQPAEVRRLAYRLYNHNAAGYASSVDWSRDSERVGNTDVRFVREGIAKQKFARILPSYVVSTEEYRDRVETSGAGGPVMATFPRTAARDRKWPYLFPDLYCAPLCAVLDFHQGESTLTLRDPVVGESISLFGRTVPLKFDFTAPWAYAQRFQKTDIDDEKSEGLKQPDAEFQAVYMLHPPDNRRRLALFVHGLNSSPKVFRQLANALRRDPKLRANYQLVAYRYATGYSLFFNNVLFRKRLGEFYEYLQRAAPRSHAAGTVAIGHSMGGLLIKSLAQDSGVELWNRVFQQPPARVTVDTPEGGFLKNALVYKPLPEIRRLVFMAVPHRGSDLADGIVAEIGKSRISQDPRVERIKKAVLETFRADLRPNMEQRLTKPLTSVDSLRPDDLYLNLLTRFAIRVPFHSTRRATASFRTPARTSTARRARRS
jgi:pimeloyl-ACP methyl ester carboxylesterase